MTNVPSPPRPKTLTVVLVKPSKYDDDGYVIRYRKGFLPSNTLSCLYALTEDVRQRGILGNDLRWRLRVLDDTVQPIPVRAIARQGVREGAKTIVCLAGVQTNQFPRASDLAFQFRREGIDVLIGGFHVSGSLAMLPAIPPEIQALVDAGVCVVAGEVEGRWEGILKDAVEGTLQPVYNFLDRPPELENRPLPAIQKRYLRRFLTSNFGTIDAGRGCPFHCSFCTIINVQGKRMRCRDAEALIAGIRGNYRDHKVSFYFFTDDNFARNPNWEEILDGLIALREKEGIRLEFMMQADALSYRLKDFIPKAKRAGCTQVFIGVESLNSANLAAAQKGQNDVEDLSNLVAAYHAEDIMTHAAYIIGFPFDTARSVSADVRRLKHELGVKQVSFFMLMPLPGSADHLDLLRRGVPLDPDLNRYDGVHATMPHPRMSGEEWAGAYEGAWSSFYSFENMKEILESTSPERYWNVFKNFFWWKGAVAVEGVHPMVAGFFRRKERLGRRPGMPIEPRWQFTKMRAREAWRKWLGWLRLFREMEELWLETRTRKGGHREQQLGVFGKQSTADRFRSKLRPVHLRLAAINLLREAKLVIQFTVAFFSSGIR
jgi:radical SAM superfamily enzyme YgiQ (UPF0313 family)